MPDGIFASKVQDIIGEDLTSIVSVGMLPAVTR
jgi:hypothetical protein